VGANARRDRMIDVAGRAVAVAALLAAVAIGLDQMIAIVLLVFGLLVLVVLESRRRGRHGGAH
jgi:hypothetical protein